MAIVGHFDAIWTCQEVSPVLLGTLRPLSGKVHHTDQIESSRAKDKDPVDFPFASVPEFSKAADCLHPAEDLLDSFAFLLTHLITGL